MPCATTLTNIYTMIRALVHRFLAGWHVIKAKGDVILPVEESPTSPCQPTLNWNIVTL